MTAKQFEVIDYFDSENKHIKAIKDNETTEIYSMDNELEANSTCEKWNALHEENEQLKKLNIPIDDVKEFVQDCKGRIIGVYYND